MALWLALCLTAATVLVCKGRLGGLVAGVLTGGLLLVVAAVAVPPHPRSRWARRNARA